MLVLALKFSKSNIRRQKAPLAGRFVSSWEQTLPENGTERLSKRPGLGLRPNIPWSHRSNLHFDDAVINVGVANRNDWSVDSLERR